MDKKLKICENCHFGEIARLFNPSLKEVVKCNKGVSSTKYPHFNSKSFGCNFWEGNKNEQ